VAIYDFAMHEGSPFLAMELVEGASLAVLLRQNGRIPPADAVAIMLQVLDALDSAHRIGVVHRDIKPANILLMAGNRVKITDFGIARFDSSDLTQQGVMVGTPSYMSPEQCMGEPVDARSDLFSAGTVLFEMLTGERPFPGRTSTEITYRLVHQEPSDLAAVVPGASPALAAVVRRSLAKQPSARFASARDMAGALRTSLAAPPADDTVVTQRPASRGVGTAEAQQAEKALAQYLGPIAKVLVRRAVQRASSPGALWDVLALEIEHPGDRAAFLRQRPPE